MRNRLLNIINNLYPTYRNVWIENCSTNGNWYLITIFLENTYNIISLRDVQISYSDEKIINMIN